MIRTTARLLLLVWTIVLVGAMLTPGEELPQAALFTYDKLLHLCAFVLWASLAWHALPDVPHRGRWVLLLALGLAVATESAQGAFPHLHRSAEVADAVADLLGTGIALGLARLTRRRASVLV